MKVLILAAGYGTRLYPVIQDTPKPLLEIAGKHLLCHLTDKIQGMDGLTELILVTNNKFYGMFRLWAKQNAAFPFPVTVINDGTQSPEDRLGSIGDIAYVLENRMVDDDLFVLGGDNLFDYSLDSFADFARSRAPAVTIGLYDIGSRKGASAFGVVELGEEGRLLSFEEKPRHPRTSLIAMCSYYFPRASLGLIKEYVKETGQTDKAGDYIHWLAGKGDVYGFQFQGTWYDIGSLESLREAQQKFQSNA
jgi:glucose-1-phosphate thymidylyltransferase